MRYLAFAVLCISCQHAAFGGSVAKPRELVYPFPPTGLVEVAGTVPANRVLRMVQRYTAPAFTDLLATHIGHTLQGESDPPVTVTRKPRAIGRDAERAVSAAAPDGRTLLLTSRTPDEGAMLKPVAAVASMPYVAVASSDAPYADFRDFVRHARRGGDRLFIATPGGTSVAHAAIERLRMRHALRLEAIAYNGGTAALQAAAAHHVGVALVPLPAVLPYLGGGRLKVLVIADARRHSSIPNVPTAAEAGVPQFEATDSFRVFVPAATPTRVVSELDALLARSAQSEQSRQLFSDLGLRFEHRRITAPASAEM